MELIHKLTASIIKPIGKIHFPYIEKKMEDIDMDAIESLIQPADIVLTRTLGWASSVLNADTWKHVAIYVGDGKIIEAVSPVVRYRRLDNLVFKTDYVSVLRLKDATPEDIKHIIDKSKFLLGRPYDYRFDIDTESSVYCSELAYHCLKDIRYVYLKKMLGEWKFSPQDVYNCDRLLQKIYVSAILK